MKSLLVPFAAITALGATAALAEPVAYDFDPSHSQVAFEYSHLGFSTSVAIINGVTGKLMLDKENPANSSVEATIPMEGLHMIAADLDGHVFGKDFLNTDKASAVATFKSTKVELGDDKDEAKVTGDFTLNGVTKPVVLDVDLNQLANHPMSGKEVAGFDAETKIKRSDFNLGHLVPAVGDELDVSITVEAGKAE